MAFLGEIVSKQFRAWEERGRGWRVYPNPVAPEPAFHPFPGYRLPEIEDDGRKPTFLSSMMGALRNSLTSEPPDQKTGDEVEEPEPTLLERDALTELQILLPAGLKVSTELFVAFLEHLDACREPVAFELLARHDGVLAQFVSHPNDLPAIKRNLETLFPEGVFLPTQDRLHNAWMEAGEIVATVDFGLEDEFILPLLTGRKLDPFLGLITAMSEMEPDEMALFQVIFEPVRNPWATSAWDAIKGGAGNFLFTNHPRLNTGAKEKFDSPLYAAVVRVMTKGSDPDRVWSLIRDLAFALRVFANPQGNALIPLHNLEYPIDDHASDILCRQSRRSGMLLNREELIGLVHVPSADIRSPKLKRQIDRTKAAPSSAVTGSGLVLGENHHMGKTQPISLSPSERVRHMHIIGASGTGKSNLIQNLIVQDIENGEGVAVLDPHGDLIDRILERIPDGRINDVVLIDPSDEEFSIGFNILSAHSDLEKNLLASDLVSVFQRLSASWGDQMGSVLQNAILAFLESSRGGTLADLRRYLIEPAFREEFLTTVRDPDIVYYWRKGFTQLSGNKSIGPVLTRLETFLAPKPIRYMVAQSQNRIDFADILDTGKILLAKLPQGQIGKENSFLLGSLLVAKFQQLAMGRQAQRVESRRPFYLYIDEFQNFITPSMAEILSGARKYKLGLVLAHQELRQLERDREVASAVLSNSQTRIVFRVGDADARALENGFSYFEARDLQNLETGHAVCRIERADHDFNLAVAFEGDAPPKDGEQVRQAVIAASRSQYGTRREEIESAIRAKFEQAEAAPAKAKASLASKKTHAEMPPAEVPKPTSSKTKSETDALEPSQKSSEPGPVPTSEVQPAPTLDPPSKLKEVGQFRNEQVSAASTEAKHESPEFTETAKQKHDAAFMPSAYAEAATPPKDLGRGGEQHKLIQGRIKEFAEKLGYRVTAEFPVLDRSGSVDLSLDHPNRRIAVEITITTTIDHEVGNVSKCLKAGFGFVAVVSSSETKLAQMKEAVAGALGPEQASLVGYFLPDHFCAHLRELAKTDVETPPPTEQTKKTRGYKVTTKAPKLTPEELRAKEESWRRTLDEGMRRKPPEKP